MIRKISKKLLTVCLIIFFISIGSLGSVFAEDLEKPTDEKPIESEETGVTITYQLTGVNTNLINTTYGSHIMVNGGIMDCVFNIKAEGKTEADKDWEPVSKDCLFYWTLNHPGTYMLIPNSGNLKVDDNKGLLKTYYGNYPLEVFSPTFGKSVYWASTGQDKLHQNEMDSVFTDSPNSNIWTITLRPTSKTAVKYPGGFRFQVEENTTGPFNKGVSDKEGSYVAQNETLKITNAYSGSTGTPIESPATFNPSIEKVINIQTSLANESYSDMDKPVEVTYEVSKFTLDNKTNLDGMIIKDSSITTQYNGDKASEDKLHLEFKKSGVYGVKITAKNISSSDQEINDQLDTKKDYTTKVIIPVNRSGQIIDDAIQYISSDSYISLHNNRNDQGSYKQELDNKALFFIRTKRDNGPYVKSINLNYNGKDLNEDEEIKLDKGSDETLTPKIEPETLQNQAIITWDSDKPEVADVVDASDAGASALSVTSNSVKIQAKSPGTALIRAIAKTSDRDETGAVAEFTVTVNEVPVQSIAVNPSSVELEEGSTKNLNEFIVTYNPPNAEDQSVTWTTEHPSIAKVENGKQLKALSTGNTNLIATTPNKTKFNVSVTVKAKSSTPSGGGGSSDPQPSTPSGGGGGPSTPSTDPDIKVSSVSINLPSGANGEIKIGDSIQLTAQVSPENATNKKVTWSSSNTQVATISQTGLVKAVGEGSTTIKVTTTDGNKSASLNLTVKKVEPETPDTPDTPGAPEEPETQTPHIQYQAHVENKGWIDPVTDGAASGTEGQGLREEAVRIQVVDSDGKPYSGLGITYRSHVQDEGWQNYVSDNAQSGTTGKSRKVEAVQLKLTGTKADQYDIWYQTHIQDYGWTNWAKNGEACGGEGYNKRMESIKIQLLPKNSPAPSGSGLKLYSAYGPGLIRYRTHVENIGWQGYVSDGQDAGTTGRNLKLEALMLAPSPELPQGDIQVSAHVQDIGWVDYQTAYSTIGTTGRNKRLEGIKIRLTGDLAKEYDVVYRSHVQDIGWQNEVKNDQISGTVGQCKKIEAIEVKLVKK